MPFSIQGYVLDKPRVGAANSPYTASPDDFVSNPSDYSAVFGTDESSPGRVEYLTLVLEDGNLPVVRLGWTKNEGGIQRFDYDGSIGTFKPLPGGKRRVVGTLGPDSNTTRLQVLKPAGSNPYRISVGVIGSGTTFPVTTVVDDGVFGSPVSGSVELSLATGNLNWNITDITTTYLGQVVLFQQQAPFSFKESTGDLGTLGTDVILLNPIPEATQVPLLRFGFGLYLTPISVANEASLSPDPPIGSFKWANTTGRVRFNPTDEASSTGVPVYYDGILFEVNRQLPRELIGSVSSPSPMTLPSVGGDLVFLALDGLGTIKHQFSDFIRVTAFTTGKTDQVQIRTSDGQVQFSPTDVLRYGSYFAQVVSGDFVIEAGLAVRFFRSPVNPSGTTPSVKDLAAYYPTTEAKLADPIIGAPMVFLPVLPIDSLSYPITVAVQQGTGSFTGTLPRLDVPSPPAGVGYTIDFDAKQLNYAQRKNLEVIPITEPSSAIQLDPGVNPSNALFSLNQGAGYVPLTIGVDTLLDAQAGSLTFVSQTGTLITSGSGGSTPTSSTVFVDLSADFSSVLPGDLLILPTGASKGVYSIITVQSSTRLLIDAPVTLHSTNLTYEVRRSQEVLVDRFFQPIQLVDPNVKLYLVRGSTTTLLTPGKDYRVSSDLGTFQTTFRLLAMDELHITYPSSQDNPDATVIPLVLTVNERATFLVRKELTTHTSPTSIIPFNPNGRTVASNPAPAVFRGGRPQDPSQYSINYTTSTITFLPDVLPTPSGFSVISDALPHGAIVNPDENVYIDYNIYEALGGENTVSVLKPNLILIPVQIIDGASSFTVTGDQRSVFPANYLLRIEAEAVYYLAAPTYDLATNLTTVNLLAPQMFSDSFTNPNLYISTGSLLISPSQPQYFVPELTLFNPNPRGMNQFKLPGDHTSEYIGGKVVYFSGLGFNDFYLVSGSTLDSTSTTTVTVTQNMEREYNTSSFTLQKSVRPVYEANVKSVQTSGSPAIPVQDPPLTLLDAVILFKKIPGQVGAILVSPTDFKIDDAGKVTLTTPLLAGESLGILYTKYRVVSSGQLRASYTSIIVPTADNGLLNQILVESFTTYIPDSFYIRVETMSNFRGQLAQQYKAEASASSPSSGPRVDNASQPKLYEQGQESVYFTEGELANEDLVARVTLKFYHDTINYLEDILQYMDGRVVGDWDGRFRFDGSTGSVVTSFNLATNQIDDRIKISNFPIAYPGPVFVGTYIQAYEAGTQSRVYPTTATVSQAAQAGAATGDPILDFDVKPLTGSTPTVFKRFQCALVTQASRVGDTTLYVDSTAASVNPPLRPAFGNGLKIAIASPTTVYVSDGSPLTVDSVTGTTIELTDPLAVVIPVGATVYLSTQDSTYQKSYRVGSDVTLDTEKGYLLYVKPYPPFDGSDALVPPSLRIQTPVGGDLLQGTVLFSNLSTSPKKFPALYGEAFDDNGDQRYPLKNPSLLRETGSGGPSYLGTELTYVQPGTGLLVSPYTVPPFVGSGSLNLAKTVITLTTGTFPSPAPREGDLVRFLTGPNASSAYHRISSVTANSVMVDVAFGNTGTGGFQITVSNNLQSGTTCTTSGAVLTDPAANFNAVGVKPGYTVVIDQVAHASNRERRQVVSVDTDTQLTLDQPFSTSVLLVTYRICNPLNTFSDLDLLVSNEADLTSILFTNSNSEFNSVTSFFNSVFTDKLIPTVASGTITGDILTSTGVDFSASGVEVGDYVFAPIPQASEGVYEVLQVIDETHLQLDVTPVAGVVTFRVCSAFGVSKETLTYLLTQQQQSFAFYNTISPWLSIIQTPVSVVTPTLPSGDYRYFTRAFDVTSISNRNTTVTSRQSDLVTSIGTISSIMSSVDRLYDSRYAWIDARINLQTGILVKKKRAVADRVKAQADILTSMIKLLAVE
jgi:hypothetical protein